MKKIIKAALLVCVLSHCCPARDAQGNYWKAWDVRHRVFAYKSPPHNQPSESEKKKAWIAIWDCLHSSPHPKEGIDYNTRGQWPNPRKTPGLVNVVLRDTVYAKFGKWLYPYYVLDNDGLTNAYYYPGFCTQNVWRCHYMIKHYNHER